MFTRLSVIALLVAALLLSACGGSSKSTPSSGGQSTAAAATSASTSPTATPTIAPTPTATPVAELSWEEIIKLLTPSTVMVRADFPATAVSNAEAGSGTGIVMSNDGYILTNAHVVDGAAAITVASSGSNRERPARIVGVSSCDDLAVIKIDDSTGLKPATFGKSSEQQVGEDVATIGYPLGSAIGTDVTITRGIISKLDQPLDPYESLIQTDAAINPGNSGGPLVNRKGEVIGVNTLYIDRTVAANINFAISIDQAQKVIPGLQSGSNHLWLGMNLGPNNYADYFGTDAGMVVEAVASSSPASAAGVQPAFLLTQLEGLDVSSKADVCKILRSHKDGDGLKVQFLNITQSERQLLEGEVTIGQPTSTAKVAIIDRESLGSAETPSASSTASSGDIKQFSWDFASDNGDWYTGSESDLNATISDGAYNITLTPNIYYIFTPKSVPNAGDQSIKADVNLQKGFAGLVVRYSKDSNDKSSYYDCFIYDDGTYSCGVQVQGQWSSLVDPTASDAIKSGQSNALQLTVVGTKITFNVNGTDVTSFDDSKVSQGIVGLEAGSPKEENGSSSFGAVGAAVVPQ